MDFNLEHAVTLLRRTPVSLSALLSDIPEVWLHSNEGEGSWSPFEIVGHLLHGEETDWIPRARLIMEEGESGTFEPFDRTAMLSKYKNVPLDDLLAQFEKKRFQNLEDLGRIAPSPGDFSRKGNHPALGPVTLGQLLATWVTHDHSHIAQISRVLSKQYREAVGPWRGFLPILDR